jgi:hypothetical protein
MSSTHINLPHKLIVLSLQPTKTLRCAQPSDAIPISSHFGTVALQLVDLGLIVRHTRFREHDFELFRTDDRVKVFFTEFVLTEEVL